jgi:glycosyltransferase involved in cell wall biosynthesis
MENKFIIVVPVYNAENYIQKCLDSILDQEYRNFVMVVINDCSTDKTYEIIHFECMMRSNRFYLMTNATRKGSALENIVNAIELYSANPEDIIVIVDGDDHLKDSSVLNYLDAVYSHPDVCLTYGQYTPLSGNYAKYCRNIEDTRNYRKSRQWLTSHLLTFKRKLFDKINKEDLKDRFGNYYKYSYDAALTYPMIEMAGLKRIRFIDQVLYVYNDLNPLCEMSLNPDEQTRIANEIQDKPEYPELETL